MELNDGDGNPIVVINLTKNKISIIFQTDEGKVESQMMLKMSFKSILEMQYQKVGRCLLSWVAPFDKWIILWTNTLFSFAKRQPP